MPRSRDSHFVQGSANLFAPLGAYNLAMEEIVIASRNLKKARELEDLLAPLGLRVRRVSEFSPIEPAETGATFIENALLKARHAAAVSGLPAIADDSGLCVDALDGAPGVRSARYAGEPASDAVNNAKLLAEMDHVPDPGRGAAFVSLLVLLRVGRYAIRLKVGAVIRRLGFLLELYGTATQETTKVLRDCLTNSYAPLDPALPADGKHLHRWRLHLNVEPDELLSVVRT